MLRPFLKNWNMLLKKLVNWFKSSTYPFVQWTAHAIFVERPLGLFVHPSLWKCFAQTLWKFHDIFLMQQNWFFFGKLASHFDLKTMKLQFCFARTNIMLDFSFLSPFCARFSSENWIKNQKMEADLDVLFIWKRDNSEGNFFWMLIEHIFASFGDEEGTTPPGRRVR